MPFKLFPPNRRGSYYGEERHRLPMMTANPDLFIVHFNKAACQEYFQTAKYIQVMYDEERRIIGIKPMESRGEETYKLKFQTSRLGPNSATLKLLAFCRRYGLILSGQYKLRWNNPEGLIEIHLDQGGLCDGQ